MEISTVFVGAAYELMDLLPLTLAITVTVFLLALGIRRLAGRRGRSPLLLFGICLYLSFLIYGTCLSRMSSFADFWNFGRWSEGLFVYNVLPTGEFNLANVSVAHGLLNVLLFVPWGALGVFFVPRLRGILYTTLAALAASILIEAFQRSHGMGFVVLDITCNVLGSLAGSLLCLPVLRWIAARKAAQ